MNFLKYIAVLLLSVVISSCDKSSPDCFKKAGVQSTVIRTLTPFKNVIVEANIEVVLIKGAEYSVQIYAPKNLLDKVITSVSDGTLTIDNDNGCNFVRGYKHKIVVAVTAPEYDFASTNSIGSIRTDENFAQDTIFFYSEGGDIFINGTYDILKTGSHGNGNVYFKGTTNKMFSYMNGTNYLYAEDGIITNYIFIENISLADAFITAPTNGGFDYHIWKTGNIYYKGDPAAVNGKSEKSGIAIKK